MRYVFIINPNAGKGTKQIGIKRKIEECFAEIGGDFAIYETETPEKASEVAVKEAQSGGELTIFACGGEGTSFRVINSVIGFDNVAVGVIPCGSANDFLKFFDNAEKFSDIKSQVGGTRIKTDLIKTDAGYCLNGCSVGMDAVVARDMTEFKRLPLVTGASAYKLSIIKTFLGRIGVNIRLSIDSSAPVCGSYLFAVIANAPYYGGGYKAAPEAVPFDGMLDFTTVEKISKLKIPHFLSLYKNGNHGGLDYCKSGKCRKMSFSADCPIPINLDGEIIERTEMSFEIAEKALSFVVPKGVKMHLLTNV